MADVRQHAANISTPSSGQQSHATSPSLPVRQSVRPLVQPQPATDTADASVRTEAAGAPVVTPAAVQQQPVLPLQGAQAVRTAGSAPLQLPAPVTQQPVTRPVLRQPQAPQPQPQPAPAATAPSAPPATSSTSDAAGKTGTSSSSTNRGGGSAQDYSGSVKLLLLHFNDWHNRMEPNDDFSHALCDKQTYEKGECW